MSDEKKSPSMSLSDVMLYPDAYEYVEHHWSCTHEWFNKYLKVLDQFLAGKNIKNILDLGANTGSVAQVLCRRMVENTGEWPELVALVEPNPDNHHFLLATVNGLNKLKEINLKESGEEEKYKTVYKLAECACYYSKERYTTMSAVDQNRGGFFLSEVSGIKDKKTRNVGGKIRVLSLEEIAKAVGMEHVDLAKIDIEGAEWNVIENSTFLKEKVHNIVIEIHDKTEQEAREIFQSHLPMFDIKFVEGEQFFMQRKEK